MKQHRIDSVLDMLKLSPEEFGRMLPDLLTWYEFNRHAEAAGATCTGFIWVDDGRPGEIHSVIATVPETGEEFIVKGSAYGEQA